KPGGGAAAVGVVIYEVENLSFHHFGTVVHRDFKLRHFSVIVEDLRLSCFSDNVCGDFKFLSL
ncbi:11352_t:CDS:1, partial [Dentiscutata heterogama]